MTDLTTGPLSAEQQNLQPMEKRNPWTRGAQKPPGDLSFCERFRALVGAPFVSDKLRTELRWLFSSDLRGGYCPPTYALLLLGHHCRPLHRHTCLQACTGKLPIVLDNGLRIMDYGSWSMDYGSWSMDHGPGNSGTRAREPGGG